LTTKYDGFDDNLPIDQFYDFHSKILKELIRVSDIVFYNISIVTGSKRAFFKLIGEFNEQLKDIIVWDKGYAQPSISEKTLNRQSELILVFEKNGISRRFQQGTFEKGCLNDVWQIKPLKNKSKEINHAAKFPDELVEKILTNAILNEAFTENIAGATILKINDIIQMLEVDEYWSNSYTRYTNKIGLSTNNRYLDEVTDVVLDFPYKDSILKAGMTKDDASKGDAEESFLNEIVAREEIDVLLDEKIFKNIVRRIC